MRLFRRSQREFEEEVRAHLEIETDQLIAEGHSPADARQLARKRFGNVGRVQERYYDSSPLAWLHDALTDVRYSLRMTARHPGFSGSVMSISALGLVACVTTFSVVSGILFEPFPFPEPERVFSVTMRGPGVETWSLPIGVYDSLARSSEVEAVAAGRPRGVILRASGELRRSSAYLVTPSFFNVYRLTPALGRFFGDSESGALVLGYDEWRTQFGGDSGVIGRAVTIDGAPHRIVGVMPRGFHDQRLLSKPLYLPWSLDRAPPGLTVNATLRIRDALNGEKAAASLRRHRAMIESRTGGDSVMTSVALLPVTTLLDDAVGRPLVILLAAVLFVLALVAANVATMFLAQVSSREGELGVRRALGAGRGRQLRQLIVESLTLTAAGGLGGIALSAMLIALVRRQGIGVLPRMQEVGMDWRVALFALAVIIVTGLAGGLAQGFASRERRWVAASARLTGSRTSTTLVVTQMALSVVLLVGAGLLAKAFMKAVPDTPGFEVRNRATMLVGFVNDREARDTSLAAVGAAITRVQEGLRGVPGVEDVAVGSYLPLTGLAAIAELEIPMAGDRAATAHEYFVSDNYFGVMGMTVMRGRPFAPADGPGSERVAIVSETAARRFFGRLDVVGERLRMKGGINPWQQVTIVGVVNDTRTIGSDTRMRAQIYRPRTQYPMSGVTFIAAARVDPAGLMPALRRTLADVAPRAVIEEASDLEEIAARSVDQPRFFSIAMGLFAGAAALLTGLGVHGLLSYAVTQRRREIGIRLALGATASRIGATVLGRAATIAAIGIPIGTATAYGLSRYMGSLLLEVPPTDAQVFTLAPSVALLFGLAAAVRPVYRAVRIDPNETMRV